MNYLGEILSLSVAFSWTASALCADIASHKMGAQPLNLIKLGLSLILIAIFLIIVTGSPFPIGADLSTWFWLALSGLVGYVFGDYCTAHCRNRRMDNAWREDERLFLACYVGHPIRNSSFCFSQSSSSARNYTNSIIFTCFCC